MPDRVAEAAQTARARLAAAARKVQEIAVWALENRWATAMAGSQRWSSVGSLVLHGVVILACLINWHLDFRSKTSAIPPLVPVELVTIAEETDITPMVREQLSEPKKDRNVAPAAPAAPPETAPSFEMKLFPPPPAPPASNSKKSNQKGESTTATAEPSSAPRKAVVGDHDVVGFGDQTAMTMSLIDALRNQIAQCWHPPPIAAGGGTAVSFELFLDRDGSVSRPPHAAGPAASAHSEQQGLHAAEEAVRRAIYTCAPYALPSQHFAEWQNLTLTFDPQMLSSRSPKKP